MKKINFFSIEQVIKIHVIQLEMFGGLHGVRDIGLLDSAINMPKATFDGNRFYKSDVEIAAAYIFFIIKNHPFLDGNKRTGLAAGLIFLKMSDYKVNLTQDQAFDIGIGVADSSLTIEDLTDLLKQAIKR